MAKAGLYHLSKDSAAPLKIGPQNAKQEKQEPATPMRRKVEPVLTRAGTFEDLQCTKTPNSDARFGRRNSLTPKSELAVIVASSYCTKTLLLNT